MEHNVGAGPTQRSGPVGSAALREGYGVLLAKTYAGLRRLLEGVRRDRDGTFWARVARLGPDTPGCCAGEAGCGA